MNITFKKIIVLSLALFAISCSASRQEMIAQTQGFEIPVKAKSDQALVYVVRNSSIAQLIKFNVFVDDKNPQSEMGYTRGDSYIYFYLNPGKHKIFSKAENWAEIEINPKASDVIFIKQHPSMGFIIARNKLEIVDETEGKYAIKKGSLGNIHKTQKHRN